MKSTLALLVIAASSVGAFQAVNVAPPRSSTAMPMSGFLEGRGAKITIRDEEDSAMWFDDGAGGRTPTEKPKKPDPKKPVKKEPKANAGFKFPWDK
jgi:hypothetical protein